MNKKERTELMVFPEALDAAVNKVFREANCKTHWDMYTDKQVTTFEGTGRHKHHIELFIQGYMEGNIELRERMLNLFTKKQIK